MNFVLVALCVLAAAGPRPVGQVSDGKERSNPIRVRAEVPIPLEFGLSAPVPSPDGLYLAFAREDFNGLFLLNRETGEVREISNLSGSGFGFEWSPTGLLAFRGSLGKIDRKHVIGVAHVDGIVEVATPLLDDLSLPLWDGDTVVAAVWGTEPRLIAAGPHARALSREMIVCHPSGKPVAFGRDMEPVRSGEFYGGSVFFLPRFSVDHGTFLLHCLDGHLYLGKTGERTLTDIGEGSGARFARDDGHVIFERTVDDGHRVVASDLFLYAIDTRTTTRLTETPDAVERNPSMAGDGVTVFWEQDGKVMEGLVR